MKTIQLSERELSIIFSLMAPPYRAEDIRSDEFNELRNKVFYALRDAKNDEPVREAYKLPVIGWLRADYLDDNRKDDAPLFVLGEKDPSTAMGVAYIPLVGSPASPDSELRDSVESFLQLLDDYPEQLVPINRNASLVRFMRDALAAPQQEARKSNVIGSYQGADGQEHPIVSLSAPQQE
ncbi:TPA: hypothetical protein U2Q41_002984 [Citrobacter koseri]|nr:hypothetical protein [Citrobacter koseri]HEM8573008.1 hypothetical protein [Citrobacter koseri]